MKERSMQTMLKKHTCGWKSTKNKNKDGAALNVLKG